MPAPAGSLHAAVPWGRDRLGDLVALAGAAMPDERLTADELEATCFDDGGVVLGTDDGLAAVAAVRRPGPGGALDDPGPGHVRLVAVHPELQRSGVGRALLEAAHEWLWAHGATEVWAGREVPHYLWPGVDVRCLPALCLFEAAGYRAVGAEVNLGLAVPLRPAPVEGVRVQRVLDDADAEAVVAFVDGLVAAWSTEVTTAIEHGSCVAAWAEADGGHVVVGLACHSVNRAGWVGPVLTDPAWRRRGVGRALLVEVGRDLATADLRSAEVAWAGSLRFYAGVGDAWVSRAFRTLRLDPPSA